MEEASKHNKLETKDETRAMKRQRRASQIVSWGAAKSWRVSNG